MSGKAKGALIRGLITATLVAVLLYHLDLRTLSSVLSSVTIWILIPGILTQICLMLVATRRWQIILTNFEITHKYRWLFKLTWIGNFFNQFLPSSIGGDIVRTYYLAKEKNVSMATTLTATVMERSGGLGALLAIGFVAAWAGEISIQGVQLVHVYFVLGLIYILVNLALFDRRLHRLLSRALRRLHLRHLDAKLEMAYSGVHTLSHNGGAIVLVLVLSILIQFMAVVIVWISSRALGLESWFWVFLIFVPLINLSIMVPLTINGFGLRESLYLLLFSQVGLEEETAVAMSLVNTLVIMATSLPGGVLYALHRRRSSVKSQLKHGNLEA